MSNPEKRNLEIQELIKDFSRVISESEIKERLVKLNSIYKGNFRHKYSQMLVTIQNLEPSARDILIMNFEKAFEMLERDKNILESEEVLKNFDKLYDHVMLDVSRLSYIGKYYGKQDSELKEKFDNAQTEMNNVIEKYSELKEKFEKTQAEMNNTILRHSDLDDKIQRFSSEVTNAKSEYITILSILAAIMLAGIGGFSVLGNFASVLKEISLYRFFAGAAFLGIILFNVVFMLIYMIARLIGKNIYTICVMNPVAPKNDCFNGECGKRCCGLFRIKNRLPYVFWYNLISFMIIVSSLTVEQILLKFPVDDYIVCLGIFFCLELAVYFGVSKK